jgi:putative tryptophan/tyrosine transport system substrate-binding protein
MSVGCFGRIIGANGVAARALRLRTDCVLKTTCAKRSRIVALSAPFMAIIAALLNSGAASQGASPVKVAILTTAMSPWHPETEGFRDGLKALGYSEGNNVALIARAAEGDPLRLNGMAEDLVREKPHLLFCVSSPGAQACHAATSTTPIVVVGISDPIHLGLAASLARPGGNLTGVASLNSDLTAKRLELFKEIVPSLQRVLVTYDPRERDDLDGLSAARTAADRLGLHIIESPVTEPLQIEPALEDLEGGGVDGILIVQSGQHLNIPGRSLEVATSNRIPTMYPRAFWSKFGALASFGPDQYEQGRQAARLAGRILTGTAPVFCRSSCPNGSDW